MKMNLACFLPLAILLFTNVAAGFVVVQKPTTTDTSVLQQQVDDGQIVGASHLVVYQGNVVKSERAGWIDIEDKRTFEADSIVRIYSMSKPITSVAAMILWEQRKFQLDDPVSKFIPGFANIKVIEGTGAEAKLISPKREMTVRDVFRHTTGFSYGDEAAVKQYYEKEKLRYHGPAGMFVPEMTIEQAAEAMARIPALHHPGERFTYGFSTDLLGRLIEVWSGQTLDQYLQQALLGPLEMSDTGFLISVDKRARFASCHSRLQDKLVVIDKAAKSPFCDGFQFLSGGGGLVSTQNDYANFCELLVNGGTFRGKSILKPETLELMFTDQLDGIAGPFRFGLGFAINEIQLGSNETKRTATQYSWGGYASTDFRIVPSEKLYQIFLRQHVPSANESANQQIQAAYAELK